MPYELGVDLGTTYTAAAVGDGGEPTMVGLGNRALQVPSVLFLADSGFVVGEAAERRGATEPRRLVREFKRRLGDPVPVLVDGSPFSAESLSATLLRWVVEVVTRRQGEPPVGLVLTHPASWGEYKLDVLRQVASLADVGPARWCPEPVAAAAQYASRSRVAVGDRLAVYDLGGGTFDVCVLEKTEAGFTMLGTAEGVERLGGVDFDEAVFEQVRSVLGNRLEDLDLDAPETVAGLARLRRDCVDAKEALSVDSETTVQVGLPGLVASVRVTRGELEQLIGPALEQTMAAMARAVRATGMVPKDLAGVVLVGGSSRIPLVGEVLERRFEVPIALDTHPKHDVALGALRHQLWDAAPAPAPLPAPVSPPAPERRRTRRERAAAPTPACTPSTRAPSPPAPPLPARAPAPAPTGRTTTPAPVQSADTAGRGQPPPPPTARPSAAGPPPAARTDALVRGGAADDDQGRGRRVRPLLLVGAAVVVAAVVAAVLVLRPTAAEQVGTPPAAASPVGGTTATGTTPSSTPTPSVPALPASAPLPADELVVSMQAHGNWDLYLASVAQPRPLRRLTSGTASDFTPVLSPDRRTVIYQYDADQKDGVRTLRVMAADGSGQRDLFSPVPSFCSGLMYRPAWSPVDPTLLAVPCTDRSRHYGLYLMRTDGGLVQSLHINGNRADDPTFGPDGRLVFWAGQESLDRLAHPNLADGPLWLREVDGTIHHLPGVGSARDADPAWSPDGTRIAFRRREPDGTKDGNLDIYVLTVASGRLTKVVATPAEEEDPSWSPDGRQLAFKSTEPTPAWPGTAQARTWVVDADGKHRRLLLPKDAPGRQTAPAWTRR